MHLLRSWCLSFQYDGGRDVHSIGRAGGVCQGLSIVRGLRSLLHGRASLLRGVETKGTDSPLDVDEGVAGDAGQSVDAAQPARDRMTLRRFASVLVGYLAGPLLIGGLLFLAFYGWSIWRFGSLTNGISFVDGAVLIPEEPRLDLGEVPAGTVAEGTFVLRNLTSDPVTVIGGNPSCSCMVLSDMPINIDPMSSASLSVQFAPARIQVGRRSSGRVLLYLNADSPPVVLTATWKAVSGAEANGVRGGQGS